MQILPLATHFLKRSVLISRPTLLLSYLWCLSPTKVAGTAKDSGQREWGHCRVFYSNLCRNLLLVFSQVEITPTIAFCPDRVDPCVYRNYRLLCYCMEKGIPISGAQKPTRYSKLFYHSPDLNDPWLLCQVPLGLILIKNSKNSQAMFDCLF